MTSHIWVAFVVAAFVLAYSTLARRAAVKIRQGDQDWVEQWEALEPGRKKALNKTMRAGQPVREPEYAKLALRGVVQQEHVREVTRPLGLLSLSALVATLAGALISGEEVLLAIAAVGLVGMLATRGVSVWQRRHIAQSAEATRRLHGL